MIIPLGTSRAPRRRPVVTASLVALQAFATVLLWARSGNDPERLVALYEHWGFLGFDRPLGLLTYHWIHTGFFSLFLDVMFIVIMGMVVEDRLGHLATLALYLAGGAGAAAVQGLIAGRLELPLLGASGSGAALIGAFMVLAPGATVRLLLLFPVIGVVEVPAGWFIAAACLKDAWMGSGAGSALVGTLSGYALGFAVAITLVGTGLIASENFDLLHLMRQKRRLSEIREAAREVAARQTHLSRAAAGPAAEKAAFGWEEAAAARSRVNEAVAAKDPAAVGAAVAAFFAAAGDGDRRARLERRAHLSAAGVLLEGGDRAGAAGAFARFAEDHPRDAEAPGSRLLAAVLRARHLGDWAGARALLAGLEKSALGADDRAVFEDLCREAGVAAGPGGVAGGKAAEDGADAGQDLRGA